jgi:hypothetical protein
LERSLDGREPSFLNTEDVIEFSINKHYFLLYLIQFISIGIKGLILESGIAS